MGPWEKIKTSLNYDTVQIVRIRNWKLGLVHQAVTLIIFAYIIFSLVIDKQYQLAENVIGTADIKVKGTSYTEREDGWINFYDAADLVVPTHEVDAAFITTNWYPTFNQTQGQCFGVQPCQSMDDCQDTLTSEGFLSGWCGKDGSNIIEPGTCLVNSWCPLEDEPEPAQLYGFHGISDFTIYIRNNVRWPNFGYTRDNVAEDGRPESGINLWTLRELVEQADTSYEDMEVEGGLFVINFFWDCNFDLKLDLCKPITQIIRLDDDDTGASGYNFRRPIYQSDDPFEPMRSRTLYKHYGARILLITSGQGKKFDLVTLLTNIGAGIGLLSVATLVSDFVAMRCMGEKNASIEKAKFRDFELESNAGDRSRDQSVNSVNSVPGGKISQVVTGGEVDYVRMQSE